MSEIKNPYVLKMKATASKFYDYACRIAYNKDLNLARYRADTAEEENAVLDNALKAEYKKAVDVITGIFEDVRTALSMASFPNIEWMTADRMFFNGDVAIPLTEKELSVFVDRYTASGNFVMLRLIAEYINKTTAKDDKDKSLYNISPIIIHLPEEHIGIYRQFAESAISLLDTIMAGTASFNRSFLDSYGDPAFAYELYNIIGDGSNIAVYKHCNVPEEAKHTFDNMCLSIR